MARTRYRPAVLGAGLAAGFVVTASACALLTRAAPAVSQQPVLRHAAGESPLSVPGPIAEADLPLPPVRQTATVARRPLVQETVAMARVGAAPAKAATTLAHPAWVRVHTARVTAPVGAPVELADAGRSLVGVVGAIGAGKAPQDGMDLWIAVDARNVTRLGSLRTDTPVSIRFPLGTALAVEAGAVQDSAAGKVVWRMIGAEPRPVAVQLGPRAESFFVVRGGIEEGAQVAVDPVFLAIARSHLKSQSRGTLRAAAVSSLKIALAPDPFGGR